MHRVLLALLLLSYSQPTGILAAEKPNFVVIFCDDLGYGDLSTFGHPTIRTPHLDRLAAEGQKWTSFYAADNVCTPSRAGLLTGRLPIRSGMASNERRVLFPDSAGGLPASEITIAEALDEIGYQTACIGKWHLGHLPEHLPTRHGFDSYFGIPYSNDMNRIDRATSQIALAEQEKFQAYDVPLMRGEEEIERPADQRTITRRYTEEAVKRIREMKDAPFFLYLAHSLPHIPLFRAPEFKDRSPAGIYGDVVEEIDWSIGQITASLRDNGIAGRTLVVFTSDNGPWLTFGTHGGTAGLLRDGKGSTWEGGQRVPTVMSWPGKLAPGIVHEMGGTLDLLPTFLSLAGGQLPQGRVFDGYDLSPVLLGTGPSPRQEMFFYQGAQLYAVRKGPFKIHFTTYTSYVGQKPVPQDPPLLYQIENDPSERFDIAAQHPEVLSDLRNLADRHRQSVEPVEDQLIKVIRKE
ncbi:MAG: sulfatase [Verrucomicrobiales bacterium]|nr:sulfatase [Verrucomicrobiales bacterium]